MPAARAACAGSISAKPGSGKENAAHYFAFLPRTCSNSVMGAAAYIQPKAQASTFRLPMPSLRIGILYVLYAISAIAYFPFSQWMATAPVGTDLFIHAQIIYFFLLWAGCCGTPVLATLACFQRHRPAAFVLLLLSAIGLAAGITGLYLGHKVRRAGMEAFVNRSRPLVAAIHQYERDHGTPPRELADLTPRHLPDVPSTGMMAYPEYRYHTGPEETERFGNRWALTVFTPGGGFNWDMMLYLPDGNYPNHGYGGSLEPIGDWAYVHE